MGEDHKENILRFLKEWRSLTLKQGQALSEGNFEQLEQLTKISGMFQERFDAFLSKHRPKSLDQESMSLLKEIRNYRSEIIAELMKGRKELADAIASLNKNRTSLNGYRQSKSLPPKLMSHRT